MRDTFAGYHPALNFIYFAVVICCGMLFMHPLALGLALLCSLSYYAYLKRGRVLRFVLFLLLPMLLLTALFNPLFNHHGATILAYFPSGNPLTAESVIYGVAAATLLAVLLCWFACLNEVFTSDKIVYLFGRACPALALLLAMTLRFVPRFAAQFRMVAAARHSLGGDMKHGPLRRRLSNMAAVLSAMLGWSLENAIDTADSMKSRGYGLSGRTAFARYRWSRRDSILLVFCSVLAVYVLIGALLGGFAYSYFPTCAVVRPSAYQLSVWLAYFLLMALPLLVDAYMEVKWNNLA